MNLPYFHTFGLFSKISQFRSQFWSQTTPCVELWGRSPHLPLWLAHVRLQHRERVPHGGQDGVHLVGPQQGPRGRAFRHHWQQQSAQVSGGKKTNPCQTFPQLNELNGRYHNAYMIHNETLYCDSKEEWRGNYSCLKVRLHFTRDKGFYYTTVFAPGVFLIFMISWKFIYLIHFTLLHHMHMHRLSGLQLVS